MARALLLAVALLVPLLLAPRPAVADEWSGATELSNASTRDAAQLKIDSNSIGDFVAAWKQSAADDIAAMFMASNTNPGTPTQYAGDYDDPQVAVGGNSVSMLAFEQGAGSTNVYATGRPASGPFGALMTFSGDGVGAPYHDPPSAQQPAVEVNHLGVGFLMFARDYYYPPSFTGIAEAIEGRVWTGGGFSAGLDLNLDVNDPRGREMSVAPDGSAFLGINHFEQGPCWGMDTAVMESDGLSGSNNPDSFGFGCASNEYNGSYPSNDRLPSNDIVMAYRQHDDSSINYLYLDKARANAGNSSLEAQEVVLSTANTASNTDPLIRTDAAGNQLVVWYDSDNGAPGNPRSMIARYRPNGGSWGPPETISSGEDYSGDFDMDVDDAGNGYVVYQRTDPTSGDEQVVASERTPGVGQGWTAPELLSETQDGIDDPKVAAGRNGQAYASWIANANDAVYYAMNSAPQCGDGLDNDSDGKTDHPADPGCTSPTDDDETDPPACSDGVDNDGDGKIDFPADPGCSSAADTDEADGGTVDSAACTSAKAKLSKAKTAERKAKKKVKKAKKKLKKAKKKGSSSQVKKAKKKVKKAKKKLKQAKKKVKKAKKKKNAEC